LIVCCSCLRLAGVNGGELAQWFTGSRITKLSTATNKQLSG